MPTLTAKLSPSLLNGNPGEDDIELLCTATVAEDVMLASYQFTWIKDDTPIDFSDDRIVVCMCYYHGMVVPNSKEPPNLIHFS